MSFETGVLDLRWPPRDGIQRRGTDGSYLFLVVEQNSNRMCYWFLYSNVQLQQQFL